MARAGQTPTHVASFNNYEAHIYIAESLRIKMRSGNSTTRENANASVCIRFRKAVQAKYEVDLGFIEPHQLRLRELDLAPAPELAYVGPPSQRPRFTPTIEDDVTDLMFNTVGECDEDEGCTVCSNGEHEYCPNDCPWGRPPQ